MHLLVVSKLLGFNFKEGGSSFESKGAPYCDT